MFKKLHGVIEKKTNFESIFLITLIKSKYFPKEFFLKNKNIDYIYSKPSEKFRLKILVFFMSYTPFYLFSAKKMKAINNSHLDGFEKKCFLQMLYIDRGIIEK